MHMCITGEQVNIFVLPRNKNIWTYKIHDQVIMESDVGYSWMSYKCIHDASHMLLYDSWINYFSFSNNK